MVRVVCDHRHMSLEWPKENCRKSTTHFEGITVVKILTTKVRVRANKILNPRNLLHPKTAGMKCHCLIKNILCLFITI